MSVELNPNIEGLEKDSLCYLIYSQLYGDFFKSQQQKDEEHPWGIEEGDENSTRLKNTAYTFANAISKTVDSNNGSINLKYLNKTGDNMIGPLGANYGFQAGSGNVKILETYHSLDSKTSSVTEYGTRFYGDLHVGGGSLYFDQKQIIAYDKNTNKVILTGETIGFDAKNITTTGNILIGESKAKGVFISPLSLQVNGMDVYHAGNANTTSIDWKMKNATVQAKLSVVGEGVFSNTLTAKYGITLGSKGETSLTIDSGVINILSNISLKKEIGLKVEDKYILRSLLGGDVQIGGYGNELILGNDNTSKLRLYRPLSEINGQYNILSQFGDAFFPASLKIRHNFGDDLLNSYRISNIDEGIIINKRLRFLSEEGAYLEGNGKSLQFVSGPEKKSIVYKTSLSYDTSTSYYNVTGSVSNSLFISTDADYFVFDKPVESKKWLGIDGSSTRLIDNSLFFSNLNYLLSVSDGIKHYGNAYFLNNISSEKFSSGFAGSGWAVMTDKATGNTSATFDQLTIRKKMRVYELEVQKNTATNGALWVSDSCSADEVIRLE